MKRGLSRSPYVWTLLGVATLVVVAWLGRESYQPVITGSVAPGFTMPMLEGPDASLADYRGEVVLVNVWATWCGPCLTEMPSMQRLYEEFEGEDFEILAVSIDAALGQRDGAGRPGGDLADFAERLGLTFPILHNASGNIQQQYQTTGVPESFLLDKQGVIVKKVAGPTRWDSPENTALIRRLLAG